MGRLGGFILEKEIGVLVSSRDGCEADGVWCYRPAWSPHDQIVIRNLIPSRLWPTLKRLEPKVVETGVKVLRITLFKLGCRTPIKNGSTINVLVLSGMFCWMTLRCDLYTQRTGVDGWMKWSITLSDTFRAVQLHAENSPSFAPFCESQLHPVFQWNMCNFPFKLVPHEPWRAPQVSVVALA